MNSSKKEVLNIWYDNGIQAKFESENGLLSKEGWKDVVKDLTKKKCINYRASNISGVKIFEYEDITIIFNNISDLIAVEELEPLFKNVFFEKEKKRIKETLKTHQEILNKKVLDEDESLAIRRILEHKKARELVPEKETQPIIPKDELAVDTKLLEERRNRIRESEENMKSINAYKNKLIQQESLRVMRVNKYKQIGKITLAGLLAITLAGAVINIYEVPNFTGKIDGFNPNLDVMEPATHLMESHKLEELDFNIALDINNVIDDKDIAMQDDSNVYLSYEDRTDTVKALQTKSKYGSLIEKYSRKCGLDPRLVLGIATQESGDHELGLRTGSRGGLMQIEISEWDGKEIEYYDFEDKQTYMIKITRDSIQDVENNILIGCAILQGESRILNYNILLSLLSYNQGYRNVSKILDKTSRETGISKMQLINDQNNLEWLNYVQFSGQGDPDYINNVLSYTGYGYDFYEFYCQKENGELVTTTTGPVIAEVEKVIK